MVRIRLRRVGKRKQPVYRVVVADSRSPRDGRFIEVIGQYKPLEDPSEIVFETDKALEWLRKGAQPSGAVTALLKRTGIWSTFVADKGPAKKPPPKKKAAAARARADALAAKTAEGAEAAATEQPAPSQPAAEAPAEKPAAEAPAAEEPAAAEAPAEEPVAEEPAAENPAAEEPASE
jgi:small subunit ribosomal protein S16